MLRPKLRDDTYAVLRDHILPSDQELRWQEIPWRRSLTAAVNDPASADAPILLWAMDGSPLGMTCGNGILGRSLLWSDPALRALAGRFVPAADDAGRLSRGTGADCDLFRRVAEQGHYGGRTIPTTTRQGVYAMTAGGTFLGSTVALDPRVAETALREALSRWDDLTDAERRRGLLPGVRPDVDEHDGVVLRTFARDLPEVGRCSDAWNQDHVWWTVGDVRGLMPEPRLGACATAPTRLAERLARFHLVDDVRGQSVAFPAHAIEEAVLRSEVTALDALTMTVRLEGRMRASQTGIWPVRDAEDARCPAQQTRGYDLSLLGRAVFARADAQTRLFELVAAGLRWGATQYNFRGDDRAVAPFGVVFRLCDDGRYVRPALAD